MRSKLEMYLAFLDFLHRPLIRKGQRVRFHELFQEFQETVRGMTEPVVVEIGARDVMGVVRRDLFPTAKRFVGFDIHPGRGVDVVGDAHRLSTFFEASSVDAVFSASVFEHLVFPWKVVLEINRVLKPGGYVFLSTHPTWPAHELPWDFWRFPVAGISNLFIPQTGFELVAASEGLPCRAYSLVPDAPTRLLYRYTMNMGVAVIARKTGDYDPERLRWDIDIRSVVESEYPKPGP